VRRYAYRELFSPEIRADELGRVLSASASSRLSAADRFYEGALAALADPHRDVTGLLSALYGEDLSQREYADLSWIAGALVARRRLAWSDVPWERLRLLSIRFGDGGFAPHLAPFFLDGLLKNLPPRKTPVSPPRFSSHPARFAAVEIEPWMNHVGFDGAVSKSVWDARSSFAKANDVLRSSFSRKMKTRSFSCGKVQRCAGWSVSVGG